MKKFTLVLTIFLTACSLNYKDYMFWNDKEEPKEEQAQEIVANKYLWQASLDKLDFIPIASADSKTGLIITDWKTVNNNIQIKVKIQINSKELRADALGLTIYKKVLKNGKWSDVEPSQAFLNAFEDSILIKARSLYSKDMVLVEK